MQQTQLACIILPSRSRPLMAHVKAHESGLSRTRCKVHAPGRHIAVRRSVYVPFGCAGYVCGTVHDASQTQCLPKLYYVLRNVRPACGARGMPSGRISARQGHLLAACRLHRRCSGSAAALYNRINFALALLLLLVLEVSDSQHAILHVGRLPSSLLLLGDPKGQWQSETISGNLRQSEAISPGTPRGSERPVAI